ncbi:ABC transporter permease [Teredinibacter sp. KSP-S5-2]|uniref:ABC transporter permease n=1 Tax=Teredinibacter sp. KSP-S5-2 TaxID=3034506 RepID=UPI0029345D20|nr:ABC transporter permease [Teredinibacter sp. KSP-S5-2]WNO11294.1 ABC transporter permease [Teredinibacter sp. KSP-S5-2]
MQVFYIFFKKSLMLHRRSFFAAMMSFGFPLVFFFLFALSPNGEKEILARIAIVDQSNGSPEYERFVDAVKYFQGVKVSNLKDFDDAKISRNLDEYSYVVVFNEGEDVAVDVYTHKDKYKSTKLVSNAIEQSFNSMQGLQSKLSVNYNTVESKKISQKEFALVGVLALALLQLAMYSTAMPLLQERGEGVMRVFKLLPISPLTMFLGDVSAKIVIGFVQVIVLLFLMVYIADISLPGSIAGLILAIFSSTLVMISIGYAIGGVLPNHHIGTHVITFTNLYMLFMGEIFTTVSNIEVLRPFVMINPVAYVSNLLRVVMYSSEGFLSVPGLLVGMLTFVLVSIMLVVCFFKYDTNNR